MLLNLFSCAIGDSDNPFELSRGKIKDNLGVPALSATDGDYPDRIRISWPSIPYAQKYYIYRSDAIDGTYTELTQTTGLYYDDSAVLKNDGTVGVIKYYYYKMKSYSSSVEYSWNKGYSDLSAAESGYRNPNKLPLPAPATISASDGTDKDKIIITWSAVTKAESYFVYRCDTFASCSDPNSYVKITATPITGLTYNDTTAAKRGTDTVTADPNRNFYKVYCYKAAAYSSNEDFTGEGLLSDYDSGYRDPEEVYNYSTQWGQGGINNGEFNKPSGISVGYDGSVFVTDSDNHRIQKFNASGAWILSWGGYGETTEDGKFKNPKGIAVFRDSVSDRIYVSDSSNDRVQKFTPTGDFILKWGVNGTAAGQFQEPFGITATTDENIFVVDRQNNRIEKFSSTGAFLTAWGSMGNGNGQFNNPLGLASDSNNNIFVVDSSNNRVQKFDANGNYLLSWGSQGTANGQFNFPTGIASDLNNDLYIVDTNNNRIQKFDTNGNFISKWGTSGTSNGEFFSPQGIAVAPNGTVYITDTNNNRIQVFIKVQ